MDLRISVLIPDGEKQLSLHVINCLSEIKNLKIHILSKFKWVETKFSNKISSFSCYPNNYSEQEWIEIIKHEISLKKINVLLPVQIENTRICAKYKDELSRLLPNFIIPSMSSFNSANNKWKLYKLLEETNITRPITYHSKLFEMQDRNELVYPILVKPLEGMGGSGIKKIDNKEILKEHLQSKSNFIIQNFIEGYDIDMSVISENGKILAYTIQKGFIKWNTPFQPSLGIEFLFEKKILDIVKKLIQKLNWTGVAHVDLRFDEKENNFKIIEINPRFWGSVEGSEKVGINFPHLFCLTSLGIKYEIPNYEFDKYVNNRGLIKILKSRIGLNKTNYKIVEHNSFMYDLMDPLPKTYKYTLKALNKLLPTDSKFLNIFKYEVY